MWTTLAGLARETSRIRLGSLVTSVTFRHPGPLAVVVAQVGSQSFDGTTLSGSPAQIVDQLGPDAKFGITRLYVRSPTRMHKIADSLQLFATDVLPQLAAV